MRNTKNILALLLALLLCLSLGTAVWASGEPTEEAPETIEEPAAEEPAAAEEAPAQDGAEVVASGACGENVTWSLDADGVFTVSGSGPMTDYEWCEAPWYERHDEVRSVVIEPGVTTVGDSVFTYFTKMTSVTLPEGITRIGERAFEGCWKLPEIRLPESLKRIEWFAFRDCLALASIRIPAGVTYISDTSFPYCKNLAAFDVAEGNADYRAVDGVLFDKSMTTLIHCPGSKTGAYTIPAGVDRIASQAFCGCGELTSVTIPEGVAVIGSEAFADCKSLETVSIPASVKVIDDGVFRDCSALTSLEVAQGSSDYRSVDGVLFTEAMGMLIQYPVGRTGAYTVPAGVESIGAFAFQGCEGLSAVTLPKGLTDVGIYAFSSCENLVSIEFPDTVEELGWGAFQECRALESVRLSGGMKTIDYATFDNCTRLKTLVVPEGVEEIGDSVFFNAGLESITLPLTLRTIGNGAFEVWSTLADVYYAGTEENWRAVEIGAGNDSLTGAAFHFENRQPTTPVGPTDPDEPIDPGPGEEEGSEMWEVLILVLEEHAMEEAAALLRTLVGF